MCLSTMVQAQQENELKIVIEPDPVVAEIGIPLQIKASLVNSQGEVLPDTILFYSRRNRGAIELSRTGMLNALKPGTYNIIAQRNGSNRDERIRKYFEVQVKFPPITDVDIIEPDEQIYTNSSYDLDVVVTDAKELIREEPALSFSSSNESVVFASYGKLIAKKAGTATITVESEGVTDTWKVNVRPNPTASIDITNNETLVRTGDVIHFNAKTFNNSGKEIGGVPIRYSFLAEPDDDLGQGATAQVSQDGRFVANKPGLYTLVATSGNTSAEQIVRVEPRNAARDLTLVGHGEVLDVHTSDLWVWEGVDGRDYAITGTWGANGDAYFWDVTDPSNMFTIDTVRVDARTVNDVKINEAGTVAVITREGASDRKNGIVILDVSDPSNVSILSEYNKELTGGVHNAFIYENHVYAVNNGTRYDIINIDDPRNPQTVGRFELDTPGHSIHDVWIEDGIAYSSNWSDGVVAVDIGSNTADGTPEQMGVAGGSPENPVMLGSYSYPSGWNHAAFPFKSESTGDFYVIAGDEAFPNGLPSRENPVGAAGWIHFVKFDGWDSPKEVARYEIPEAGTHNFWVVGDLLFVAYYNAGLRIVDISGELMGNLYEQGREIARFEPNHPDALIPNSPFTWGPQPYKGHIFISDWNSGIWAIKLEEKPVTGTN
ncbi:LVIVD repeat-containing protein [Balneola sp. MJW-20]|uniref:LVIVD repeat-containing protein n=1 Tax=Gracilimonas aurantiaca TaxID=3234185 RepID=UPI003909812E